MALYKFAVVVIINIILTLNLVFTHLHLLTVFKFTPWLLTKKWKYC